MLRFWSFLSVLVLLLGLFFLPWSRVNWGKISILPAATITVSGEAKGEQKSQIATFNAGVTATNSDKQKAVDEVNKKMTDLIAALKTFGIASDDIKTDNVSVYQQPQPIPLTYPLPPIRVGNGDWTANNLITITLRDVTGASGLTDLLNKSGATSVNGPNFTVDNTQKAQVDLTGLAVANAKQKAEAIAAAGGRKLGKLLNVVEGGQIPQARSLTAPVQPGTETLFKSVTATFELE